MTRMINILLILLMASPAWAFPPVMMGKTASAAPSGPTYVDGSAGNNQGDGDHLHIAFGTSTSAGDLLLVGVSCGTGACPAVGAGTFEDDRGNTWTRDLAGGTSPYMAIYSAIAKDAGLVTVTLTTGGTPSLTGSVGAFRGITNNTPDGTPVYAHASATDLHPGNITTSAAGVVFGYAIQGGTTTITQDANWTGELGTDERANWVHSGVYRITTGAGTYNDGWTAGSAAWGTYGQSAYK